MKLGSRFRADTAAEIKRLTGAEAVLTYAIGPELAQIAKGFAVDKTKAKAELKAAGKLECDGGVHITRTQCQFPCDQGPTLSVYPPGAWYQVRNQADLERIVEQQLLGGQPVPELLMRPLD